MNALRRYKYFVLESFFPQLRSSALMVRSCVLVAKLRFEGIKSTIKDLTEHGLNMFPDKAAGDLWQSLKIWPKEKTSPSHFQVKSEGVCVPIFHFSNKNPRGMSIWI